MKNAARTTVIVSTVIIGISAILFSNALGQCPFRQRGGQQSDSQLEKPPIAKDDNEQRIFDVLENILRNQRYRNVPPQDGRFLRIITEAITTNPNLETIVRSGVSLTLKKK